MHVSSKLILNRYYKFYQNILLIFEKKTKGHVYYSSFSISLRIKLVIQNGLNIEFNNSFSLKCKKKMVLVFNLVQNKINRSMQENV